MKKAEVPIEAVAFRGYGVGRLDGKVVFVPYTVTGDRAWIDIVEEKKHYSIGKLIRVVDPSPSRVTPPCPYFGTCGGCQWQHIDYRRHAELKRIILIETLERIGKMKRLPPIEVAPSPQPYGYRVRVQLKVRSRSLGYFRERSHEVVDIDHCPISDPLINQIIPRLRSEWTAFSQMEAIEINVSRAEEKAVLILHPLAWNRNLEERVRKFFQEDLLLKGMVVVTKKGQTSFGDPFLYFIVSYDRSGGKRTLKLRASALTFFQVNPEQNRTLIQTVLELSDPNKERLLELYAGLGNLTLPLAAEASRVTGVEENRKAVEDARFNAGRNGVKNCDFIPGKAEEVLKNRSERPDQIILDPPRTGCKTMWSQIAGLEPEKIIYVSCEPTTFSRDIRFFGENGYSLRRLSLIDMFPQTYHMEVVGLLQPC